PVAVPLPMPMPMQVMLPVAAPMPMPGPMPAPAALFQQVALMQSQMLANLAALQQFAAQPMLPAALPLGGTGLTQVPLGGTGVTQVSMVSVGGPGGVCSEQMQILRGPNGQVRVLVHRSGNACGPVPTAAPGIPMGAVPAQLPAMGAKPHLPPGALPPPSKLIYADYPVPAKTAPPAQQG
ncbi:hypothetical protein, partial [Acidiphilium sp.]|uniref:hypothetical protein n=1 Tax=Acidiphilium sp. TaxID=527 RepID=UPI003D0471A5